jgi:hypothetical protein
MLVALRAMPMISVAFHSEAPLHSLHHEVNPVAVVGRVADADLGPHMEAPIREHSEDGSFEARVETLLALFCCSTAWVEHVTEKPAAHTRIAQHI